MSERDPVVVKLKSLVEEVLGERLQGLASLKGGYSYNPCSLFLVLMYGYMHGQRSSRKLEDACRFDARYMYISDGLEPDHGTLCRFRQSLGSELEELFLEICLKAQEKGILKRVLMAVDGTKVAAVRSQWHRAIKSAEAEDELEAKTLLNHGEYLIGYNVQVAADADSGMVVGYVATSQAADQVQMREVLEAVERQSGGLPETVVADRGYDSNVNAQALADKNVEACLPQAAGHERLSFTVDEKGDVRCPAGHKATKMKKDSIERGIQVRYRVTRCTNCEMKEACGVKGSRREITSPPGTLPVHRLAANELAASPEGQRLMRLRGPTIERIFGQFKGNQGFRRFLLRGLAGAAIEIGLLCIGYNLRALLA